MAIPTYDQCIEPLLRFLALHPDGVAAHEAHEAAANALALSETARQLILPSGAQLVYKNRAGWAHDRLKRAGLSQSLRRGYWCLTNDGQEFVRQHPQPLTEEQLDNLIRDFNDVRLKGGAVSAVTGSDIDGQSTIIENHISPDEKLESAVSDIRQVVASDLLDHLARVSPTHFEVIVLDLLHRMGYGTSRADLQRVGGSGDGGIDGIISLDRLGLEKVYVQAKRWQQTVGRPEVQGFYGALAGQRARKGVFITTSGFTQQATEFARSVEQIVLVDGARLTSLMIEYEIGITSRQIRVPRLDSDYFDEEAA